MKTFEIINDDLKALVDFFDDYVKMETDGKSFGVACDDGETGELSLNIGKIELIDNKFELWIDIRVPAKLNNQDIIDGM